MASAEEVKVSDVERTVRGYAAEEGHFEIAEMLLREDAGLVNAFRIELKWNLLLPFVQRADYRMWTLFLHNNQILTATDKWGQTTLDKAARWYYQQ